jgi:AraC family transcriptional activator of pobA
MSAITEQHAVLAFRLYGERGAAARPDLLHWESIQARSRLHNWKIRPHRHHDLSQLLYVQNGPAGLHIDGRHSRVDRATLVWMPPLHVHGFDFHRRIRGHILTLSAPLVTAWQTQWPAMSQALARPLSLDVGRERDQLDRCFAAIADEHAHRRDGRESMLHALAGQLLTWAARQALRQADARIGASSEPGERYVRALLALVDRHYREHWPLQRYAAQLGLSQSHLGAMCRQLAGSTPLQLLQQRVMLEAQRSLIYTTMTVQQIATDLGFADAAYFSRYFTRNAGCSPKRFRQTAQASLTAPSTKST